MNKKIDAFYNGLKDHNIKVVDIAYLGKQDHISIYVVIKVNDETTENRLQTLAEMVNAHHDGNPIELIITEEIGIPDGYMHHQKTRMEFGFNLSKLKKDL